MFAAPSISQSVRRSQSGRPTALSETEMATTTQQQARVNALLQRITSLVSDRNLLRQRDAGDPGLQAISVEIDRLQWRLARMVCEQQQREKTVSAGWRRQPVASHRGAPAR
jgi:hypothetical protein